MDKLFWREALELLGFRVDVVNTGQEAVAAMAHTDYALVFMDCHMPELDGFEATKLIRAHETGTACQRTPILALTADALAGDRERCLAAGMDDYLSKPFTYAQVQSLVSRWLPQVVARAA